MDLQSIREVHINNPIATFREEKTFLHTVTVTLKGGEQKDFLLLRCPGGLTFYEVSHNHQHRNRCNLNLPSPSISDILEQIVVPLIARNKNTAESIDRQSNDIIHLGEKFFLVS